MLTHIRLEAVTVTGKEHTTQQVLVVDVEDGSQEEQSVTKTQDKVVVREICEHIIHILKG